MDHKSNKNQPQEVGFVKSVRDFLVYLEGLPSIRINDIVANEEGARGWVNSLDQDKVEVLMVDEAQIVPGQLFKRTGEKLTISINDRFLGRVVNPLGKAIDSSGKIPSSASDMVFELDSLAPGINKREFITRQFCTGITLVDTIIPLGRGQRELILGDARSGKADFLVDIIFNQKQTGTICIYAAIGKPVAEISKLIETLNKTGIISYTVVVAASSADPAPLIFLTPQTAFSIAEYFQKKGRDVLIILDDFGIHAKVHREISLLAGKAPGRDSYPGDIFYQQSHLLERAGNFKKEAGGGSITALPVIEISLDDFTTYIPTNLMSMTDGHLLFKSSLYNQGQRPSIDIPFSVTRVGQQTQKGIQNFIATKVKQTLAQAKQLETVSSFSFELPYETQLILRQKEIIEELIKQPSLVYIPIEIQTILLTLPYSNYFKDKDQQFIKTYYDVLLEGFSSDPELLKITKAVFNFKNFPEFIATIDSIGPRLDQIIASHTISFVKKGGQ